MPKVTAMENARVSVQLYMNDSFHLELKQLALKLQAAGYSKAESSHIRVNDLMLEGLELLKQKYNMTASPYYSDSSRIIEP